MTLKQKMENQLEAKLSQWQSEIDKAEAKASEAKAKAEHAEAAARSAAWGKVEDLKKQLDNGEQQLARLKQATEENWDSLKDQISRLVA